REGNSARPGPTMRDRITSRSATVRSPCGSAEGAGASTRPGNENGPPVRASRSQWALCPACRESYAGGVHLSTGEMVVEESMPEVPADNHTDAKPSLDATAPKRASADPDVVLLVCREIFTFFEWLLV